MSFCASQRGEGETFDFVSLEKNHRIVISEYGNQFAVQYVFNGGPQKEMIVHECTLSWGDGYLPHITPGPVVCMGAVNDDELLGLTKTFLLMKSREDEPRRISQESYYRLEYFRGDKKVGEDRYVDITGVDFAINMRLDGAGALTDFASALGLPVSEAEKLRSPRTIFRRLHPPTDNDM